MGNGKIQGIGVKEKTLEEAEKIHYGCLPRHWQMFEILVTFCKDHPNEFTGWKRDKLEQMKKRWQEQKKKLKK